MKKIFKPVYLAIASVFLLGVNLLTSCTDFADTPGKSVWSEGTWILPLLTGLSSAFFGWKTYKASTSGSTETNQLTGVTTSSDENVPFYKVGWFYFSVGLLIATIFIIWNTVSNR